MHHQCIVLSISELQRIDDLCIYAVIYAGLESSCSRFGGTRILRGPHNFGGVVIRQVISTVIKMGRIWGMLGS